jgi:hypothetical protein
VTWDRTAKPVVIHDDEREYVMQYVAKRSERRGDCIEWTGQVNAGGRAIANLPRRGSKHRSLYAYRVTWALAKGDIPAGLLLCHHCDNPLCVNVAHLFLGTAADNARDMVEKGRNVLPDPRYGMDHHSAKHDDALVQRVRELWVTGRFDTYADLGVVVGVGRATVRSWVTGSTRGPSSADPALPIRSASHPRGRLSDEQVAEILRRYRPPANGVQGNAIELAREFYITPQYVAQLAKGQWRRTTKPVRRVA